MSDHINPGDQYPAEAPNRLDNLRYADGVVLWDDVKKAAGEEGNTTQASNTRVLKFFAESSNKAWKELWLPNGLEIKLRQRITFNRKVGLLGAEAALGTNKPHIYVDKEPEGQDKPYRLVFPHGARVESVNFSAESGLAPGGIMAFGFWGTDNDPNVDSSIKYCAFNVGADNIAIHYNGRNCRVENCAFSDGVRCTALKLQYYNIYKGEEAGWRKNFFQYNQVHLGTSCTAVVVNGASVDTQQCALQDFRICNNKFDIGCRILYQVNCVNANYQINHNEWTGADNNWNSKQDGSGVIEFRDLNVSGTINNNTFNSQDVSDNKRPNHFIRWTNRLDTSNVTVYGNSFMYNADGKYAVKFEGEKNGMGAGSNVAANDNGSKCGNGAFNWGPNVANNSGSKF